MSSYIMPALITNMLADQAACWLRDRVNERGFTSGDLLGVYETGECYPPLADLVVLINPEIADILREWYEAP